jgi:hypothetical protein
MRIMIPTAIVNLSSGRVIDQKLCQALAPSTRARSYSSWGIDCRPASSTSIMKGVLGQTSTSTMVTIDRKGVANQSIVDVEEADLPAEIVDGPVLHAEHHPPRHRRHDRRDHGGYGQQGSDQRPAPDHPVQEQGDPQPEQELGDQRGHDDDDGVPDRLHETATVVLGSDRQLEVPEREMERVDQGEDDHEPDQEERE